MTTTDGASAPALTDVQRLVLGALADTFVAAVPAEDDPDGFLARPASAVGVVEEAEAYLTTLVPPDQLPGLLQLLDTMLALGFPNQPLAVREVIVRTVAGIAPETAIGVNVLRQVISMIAYGKPDPATGRNPFWSTWGYPGPVSAPPQESKGISPVVPADGDVLDADVVVVGSGSGGGVVAGELARAGHDVVVLEMGGYFDAADFNQYELWAFQNLYLRGGYFPTADMNVSLVAGSALGGGSLVNWSNSVRPRPDIRARWAEEFGLSGVDGPEFDGHVDAVLERMSVNTDCSDYNGPHQRLAEGAEALGWHVRKAALNLDPARYQADLAGYGGFGDQTGAKQGTLKTFLQDAVDAGARVLVRTRAERVTTDGGRATGIEAVYADPATGGSARVTVRARHVVVACGSLETPALLLRSGIGGPAVGRGLRLHPAGVVGGIYADDQKSWWGPPQAAILDEFADKDEGFGHLVEGIQHAFALLAATVPWSSAEQHKRLMAKAGRTSWLVGIVQDRGSGSVTVDDAGNALHWYPMDDELDRQHFAETLQAMVRIHEAAGAEEIVAPAPGLAPWRRGDDLEEFLARVAAQPLGAGGMAVFSAHQMGSARMGTDPATSVARPTGELHDTAGVWVGDTSAFPTCSGVNPMVSCMALARRTAGFLREALDSGATAATTTAPGGDGSAADGAGPDGARSDGAGPDGAGRASLAGPLGHGPVTGEPLAPGVTPA